jgi:hypothetical protein
MSIRELIKKWEKDLQELSDKIETEINSNRRIWLENCFKDLNRKIGQLEQCLADCEAAVEREIKKRLDIISDEVCLPEDFYVNQNHRLGLEQAKKIFGGE